MNFAAPLVLAGLLAVPLLIWLLRAMPPQPVRRVFGGMFYLEQLGTQKREPVRTPLWILILRIAAFCLLIIGLAGPQLGSPEERQDGDLLIVLGDGWDAAQNWESTIVAAERAAARSTGAVRIMTTTDGVISPPYSARAAEEALKGITPRPRLADWNAVAANWPENVARTLVLPGGVLSASDSLPRFGTAPSVLLPEAGIAALGVPQISPDRVTVPLHRTEANTSRTFSVRALSADGRTIASERVTLEPGAEQQDIVFRLPLAMRNELSRFQIDGLRSAGAVALLGSSSRQALAGLVSTGSSTLREGGFYLTRALSGAASVVDGEIGEVLAAKPGLVILDDVGTLRDADRTKLERFVEEGGLLLRFAGPSLIAAETSRTDTLLPAPLLGGERALGGALTWAKPQLIAVIDQESPLSGLTLDEDIAVRRQVLTEPGAQAEVWASLADGTPLISASRLGEGIVVLIHVSALPTWSDFPISGLFSGMMKRLAAMAATDLAPTTAGAAETLPARKVLTGRGQLADPDAGAPGLTIGAALPAPGLYGEGASETAVNAFREETLRPLTVNDLPRGARVITPLGAAEKDLSSLFVAAALLLFIIDALATLRLSNVLRPAAVGAAVILVHLTPESAVAQQLRPPLPGQAVDAALDIRFAYVRTGIAGLDRISEAGLNGLTQQATARSALEPAPPQGVNLDRDELSVYTIIYWPIRPGMEAPSEAALQRLEAFMDSGGMLIIDTADGSSPSRSSLLSDILGRLDAPPLEPLQDNHVLLLSFYRLEDLVGRNSGGQVWVETPGALDQRRDGVPSLIISGRDWASAWALDERGIPLRPAGPGGEARREYAFRAGINMAMVAITGNYKADQADVQDLLDRLGRDQEQTP